MPSQLPKQRVTIVVLGAEDPRQCVRCTDARHPSGEQSLGERFHALRRALAREKRAATRDRLRMILDERG